jgi:hypothetical protein
MRINGSLKMTFCLRSKGMKIKHLIVIGILLTACVYSIEDNLEENGFVYNKVKVEEFGNKNDFFHFRYGLGDRILTGSDWAYLDGCYSYSFTHCIDLDFTILKSGWSTGFSLSHTQKESDVPSHYRLRSSYGSFESIGLYGNVRYTWNFKDPFSDTQWPAVFIGGGISATSIETSCTETKSRIEESDSDSAVGIWLEFGMYWTFKDIFTLGFDIRAESIPVHVFGEDRDAGGMMLNIITLGLKF